MFLSRILVCLVLLTSPSPYSFIQLPRPPILNLQASATTLVDLIEWAKIFRSKVVDEFTSIKNIHVLQGVTSKNVNNHKFPMQANSAVAF